MTERARFEPWCLNEARGEPWGIRDNKTGNNVLERFLAERTGAFAVCTKQGAEALIARERAA